MKQPDNSNGAKGADPMKDTPFLEAFNQGRSARRNGRLKSSNPYLIQPNLHHLKRT